MENFKELIIFLRIMLESEDTAHNDIALGALHKIFYISYTVSNEIIYLLVLLFDCLIDLIIILIIGSNGSCNDFVTCMET